MMRELWISEEEIADIKACLPSDKAAIEYWLTVGVPDGVELSDSYPQELIDEVRQKMAKD